MAVIQRVVKPTTRRGKRALLAREPQIIEGPKRTLLFHGRKASEKVRNLLRDIYDLKKPDAHKLTRKNDVTIFEDSTPVEAFCRKHDCSIFVMVSHSKKRPDNLIVGRTFDYSLLDMVELGVESYQGLKDFAASKITMGIIPCLVFAGPVWEQTDEMKTLRSIFVDLFHREKADAIRLQGLEHVLSFTATDDGKILIRSYKTLLKKSGSRTPRIELEEIGPHIDLTVRRSKLPSEDLMKQACRKPKQLKIRKTKNISRDGLGTTHGRIHVGKQDLNKLQTRKMKGLRKTSAKRKSTGEAAEETKKPEVQDN
ncbi:Novel nucleolar protein 3 [Carabus blaptoides fortunei]